jgi:hypothetical protein
MTDTNVIAQRPGSIPLATDPKPKPYIVSGKLATAIRLMIEDGTPWNEAAITVRHMRKAMADPRVIKWMKAERDVFRDHVCAGNIRRLAQIRDAADNMPAVNAIKALEQLGDDEITGSTARQSLPGVVIQIVNNSDSDRSTLVNVSHEPKEAPL